MRRGERGEHGCQERHRRDQRGQAQRYPSQATAGGNSPAPGEHRNTWQDAGDAKALEQDVGENCAALAGDVGDMPRGSGVERWIAWIIGSQRQQDHQAKKT